MLVEQLDLKTFKNLSKDEIPALIKFHSNGCHYCNNLDYLLEEVAENYPDLKFYKINVDKYPTMPAALGFDGVPTILLYNIVPNKKYQFLKEPPAPNKKTWYSKSYIERNINKHYKGIKK
jgi:thiol-disulfide isomerase/thioredoxin